VPLSGCESGPDAPDHAVRSGRASDPHTNPPFWTFRAEHVADPLAAHNRMSSAAIWPTGPSQAATLVDVEIGERSRLLLSHICSGDFAECAPSLA